MYFRPVFRCEKRANADKHLAQDSRLKDELENDDGKGRKDIEEVLKSANADPRLQS